MYQHQRSHHEHCVVEPIFGEHIAWWCRNDKPASTMTCIQCCSCHVQMLLFKMVWQYSKHGGSGQWKSSPCNEKFLSIKSGLRNPSIIHRVGKSNRTNAANSWKGLKERRLDGCFVLKRETIYQIPRGITLNNQYIMLKLFSKFRGGGRPRAPPTTLFNVCGLK